MAPGSRAGSAQRVNDNGGAPRPRAAPALGFDPGCHRQRRRSVHAPRGSRVGVRPSASMTMAVLPVHAPRRSRVGSDPGCHRQRRSSSTRAPRWGPTQASSTTAALRPRAPRVWVRPRVSSATAALRPRAAARSGPTSVSSTPAALLHPPRGSRVGSERVNDNGGARVYRGRSRRYSRRRSHGRAWVQARGARSEAEAAEGRA